MGAACPHFTQPPTWNTSLLGSTLTNSAVEGWNSKIRMISHRAFGCRSADALIAMIKLNCSGIELCSIWLLNAFTHPYEVHETIA